MLKGRFSEPCGLAGQEVPSAHTALLCQGTCHGQEPLSLAGAFGAGGGPAGVRGWGSPDQGLPVSGLVLPETFVHLSKCPGSGALGSVQRTPGDQEKSQPTLLCHSLLEQVQEGGFTQTVSFHLATSHVSEPLPQLAEVLAHRKLSGRQHSDTILPKICFVTLLHPLLFDSVFSSVKWGN